MPHYCDYAPDDPLHAPYHDKEYGFAQRQEHVLFERMILEIMQAGLSWGLILKKRVAMRRAFDGFRVSKVAAYTEDDVNRLLADEGIIRNRLKIRAVIHNANMVIEIRKSHKSFANWLDSQGSLSKEVWVKLFRSKFKFMGPEIVGEFLMSLGYLPGAHKPSCPIYKQIQRENR